MRVNSPHSSVKLHLSCTVADKKKADYQEGLEKSRADSAAQNCDSYMKDPEKSRARSRKSCMKDWEKSHADSAA